MFLFRSTQYSQYTHKLPVSFLPHMVSFKCRSNINPSCFWTQIILLNHGINQTSIQFVLSIRGSVRWCLFVHMGPLIKQVMICLILNINEPLPYWAWGKLCKHILIENLIRGSIEGTCRPIFCSSLNVLGTVCM